MTDAMIDIETLDTAPSSVVLTVGACKFDPYSTRMPSDRKLWRPSLEQQLDLGRTTSDATLAWWNNQDPEILERALSEENRISLTEFFGYLNKYLVGVDKIWCQGPQFDMVILENLFAQSRHHYNWAFWQVSDSRTVFNMMPTNPLKEIQTDAHDAAADAYYQAVCVQKAYKHFGVTAR
jgi:hypothetical protein